MGVHPRKQRKLSTTKLKRYTVHLSHVYKTWGEFHTYMRPWDHETLSRSTRYVPQGKSTHMHWCVHTHTLSQKLEVNFTHIHEVQVVPLGKSTNTHTHARRHTQKLAHVHTHRLLCTGLRMKKHTNTHNTSCMGGPLIQHGIHSHWAHHSSKTQRKKR